MNDPHLPFFPATIHYYTFLILLRVRGKVGLLCWYAQC